MYEYYNIMYHVPCTMYSYHVYKCTMYLVRWYLTILTYIISLYTLNFPGISGIRGTSTVPRTYTVILLHTVYTRTPHPHVRTSARPVHTHPEIQSLIQSLIQSRIQTSRPDNVRSTTSTVRTRTS